MDICNVCKIDEANLAWQPFGPDSNPNVFTLLGNHYRGFPVVKVCSDCANAIQTGCPLEFTHKGNRYISNNLELVIVPKYVEDALLFWETRKLSDLQ